jgi:hypothetical protein
MGAVATSERSTPAFRRFSRICQPLFVALSLTGVLASMCLQPFVRTTDFVMSGGPAARALMNGDVSGFLDQSNIEGGSYVLRAPFLLLAKTGSASDIGMYRALALPCLLALVALSVLAFNAARARGAPRGAAYFGLVLLAGNPFLVNALLKTHPEDVLGVTLCIGAVMAAGKRRDAVAGLLLGIALTNKLWAVVAIIPVLWLMPGRRRLGLVIAAATGALLASPLLLRGGSGIDEMMGAASTSGVFKPWQIWWFVGDASHPVADTVGGMDVWYRSSPDWLVWLSHPLAVLVPAIVCVVIACRMRLTVENGLLLLAIALLLRTMLDTWNLDYYSLPFVLTLVVWEMHARRRAPWLSAAVTLAGWVVLTIAPYSMSTDMQAVAYVLWSAPVLTLLMLFATRPEWLSARWRNAVPSIPQASA